MFYLVRTGRQHAGGSRGRIVNIASVGAQLGAPAMVHYCASKGGIISMTRSLALEEMLKSYPIPRLGRPEEVAAACAFLASEDAGYITAQLLGVNGGTAV